MSTLVKAEMTAGAVSMGGATQLCVLNLAAQCSKTVESISYVYHRLQIYTCIHAYMHTYIPTYLHTYIHTYIHTYMHAYNNTQCSASYSICYKSMDHILQSIQKTSTGISIIAQFQAGILYG